MFDEQAAGLPRPLLKIVPGLPSPAIRKTQSGLALAFCEDGRLQLAVKLGGGIELVEDGRCCEEGRQLAARRRFGH
jgi:hypothetical protein